MATQLIATVTHQQNDICLRKRRQTTTRAQITTTSHQAVLISTHPGFLSLALIHSASLKAAKMNTRAHTCTQAYLSSQNTWRQISLILSQPLFPFNSPRHCSLFSPSTAAWIFLYFLANYFPVTAQPASFIFSGLRSVWWCITPLTWNDLLQLTHAPGEHKKPQSK